MAFLLISLIIGFLELYPDFIMVQYPNGGETLYTNTQVTIRWLASEMKGKVVIVLYQKGVKFFTISESAENSGRYLWHIPPNFQPGENYRFRIRLLDNLAVNDFSDRDFKILKRK